MASLYPAYVAFGAALALFRPEAYASCGVPPSLFGPALALIMLAMGLTTDAKVGACVCAGARRAPPHSHAHPHAHTHTRTHTHAHTHILAHTHTQNHTNKHTQRTSPPPPQELAAALGQRRALALGMALQYGLMPALAAAAASLLALPAPLAAGVVLLFSCPGGTASNLVTHLAGGDVGLSVLMTSASTLAAVVATPALTAFYAGALVPVDAGAMAASALLLVLAPCLGGRCARRRATVRASAQAPNHAPWSADTRSRAHRTHARARHPTRACAPRVRQRAACRAA